MPADRLRILLNQNLNDKHFLYGVLSSPRLKGSKLKDQTTNFKITFRPIEIKNERFYQISDHIGQKVFHRNLKSEDCLNYFCEQIVDHFKQAIFYTQEADYHVLVNRKQEMTILKKAPTKAKVALIPMHNRKKHYLIEEGSKVDFLIKLGVTTEEGKIVAKKSDKFKQINRFLEMVDDILPALDRKKKLSIVDFGCGKAYLTFALYYYLHQIKGIEVEIQGLDLKEDVVQYCQDLAKALNYTYLNFSLGDIKKYQADADVDMVVALHACDTATDAAIEKAIHWQAKVILAVPCCQHELLNQIKNDQLKPLLKHGILKERFSALVTDAARAQILEMLNYETQILEFIDLEHTPKNLLIRAIRKGSARNEQKLDIQKIKEDYAQFKNHLNILPYLENVLNK